MHFGTRLVVLVLAALCAASVAFASEEPKSDFFTTSDGVRIHYLTLGEAGSWVVLIHGYGDTARRMWFDTGIAQALAAKHRVVALDCRNHGESETPEVNGVGFEEDVTELMHHLKIERAHIHGYSMGGGVVQRLLATRPELFITAGFGGSGIFEETEADREKASKLDTNVHQFTDAELAEFNTIREGRVVKAPAEDKPRAGGSRPPLPIDLAKITIPVLAINGEFDKPKSKTVRMWRELDNFTNIVLPGRNHLSAIAIGMPMDETYVRELVRFVDAHDAQE